MVAFVLTLPTRPRALGLAVDRRRARDRLAAVAEHEVRADVGRPPAHRDLPSRVKRNLLPFYEIRKSGRWWRFMRSRSPAWFAFFYAIWGTPLPMAPYGSLMQTSPLNLRSARPACCSIRNTGLLALRAGLHPGRAPGLWQMWRAGGELRRQAIEITLIFAALLATVGAFGIWWGGTSAPGRPIASGLPLLMLPIAAAFRAAPIGSARRAAQHLLLWISIGIAHHAGGSAGRPADQQRARRHVGAARILVAAVGAVDARADVHRASVDHRAGCTRCGGWRSRAAAAFVLARARTTRAGASALIAAGTLGRGADRDRHDDAAAAGRSAVAARRSRRALAPDRARRLRRARQAGVDDLRPAAPRRGHRSGAAARRSACGRCSAPTSSRFASFTTAASRCRPAPTRSTCTSTSARRERSGRWRCRSAASVRRCRSWTVQAAARSAVDTTFWLPVNASFVGLRGPAEMERAIDSITITPTAVVDAGARPIVPAVLAAAHYRRREPLLPRRAHVSGAGRLLDAWPAHRAVHRGGAARTARRRSCCAFTAAEGQPRDVHDVRLAA